MSDEQVKIEVDGREIDARKGAMLIEATDAAGIYIPRFCYHKHLSVAANCRMCLVEVEKAPKPMPACATPVMDGMKVFTRSQKAIAAQHATMEFLLINHPLDCPICDQGGECELQDLAMGYGGDVSQFTERKRVVRDKNIGPLVQTDMTRCIHCTRCVRFGEEIAGLRELGATGRGEHMEIGTYVAKAMTSELSGNVIDLCPVGALTNKPYRYSARAWELQQREGIAAHDGLGSNLYFHAKGAVVKRVVPRENDAVNEIWLSDRDRYSYLGMNDAARLTRPRVKRDGRWVDCDWNAAFDLMRERLGAIAGEQADAIAALASPSATIEELFLLQKLMRELGSHNIDHRLRQRDFADQAAEPIYPTLPNLADIEQADGVVLLGAYPRHEAPLVNLRLRKAALRGAAVVAVDTLRRDYNYALAGEFAVRPSELVARCAGLVGAVAALKQASVPAPLDKLVAGHAADETTSAAARRLVEASRPLVMTGAGLEQHPCRGVLMQLAKVLADLLGAANGHLAAGANAAGAWLAGAVPHRGPAGRVIDRPGATAGDLLATARRAYVLLGVEPDLDCADGATARATLAAAEFVVALHGFESAALDEVADLQLPIAVLAENEGSFVNLNGAWQSFAAAVRPQGEARPAWKILRMLGNRLELDGFDAVQVADVTRAIDNLAGKVQGGSRATPTLESSAHAFGDGLEVVVEVPMYRVDALVRHAGALQDMPQSGDDDVRLAPATASGLGLADGAAVTVSAGKRSVATRLVVDATVPEGVCLVAGARAALADIAVYGGAVSVARASGEAAA
ncbi:MAG: NADH-quinone oxidoreductase subunit G [Gammaproteobacteria bacterium]|nr:NADH-quinone oxidoreductase subunit G [Gammaproteobacteria bacterium]